MGYCSNKHEHYFFVHNQSQALELLLKCGLRLRANQTQFDLKVRMAVAKYQPGQIDTEQKISSLIKRLIDTQMSHGKLDLSSIEGYQEFSDVEFSLRNEGNFDSFCEELLRALCKKFSNIRNIELKTLLLDDNQIKHLKPLLFFQHISSLKEISLKNNRIDSIKEFELINEMKLSALKVAGNPVATEYFHAKIVTIMPTIVYTDMQNDVVAQRTFVEAETAPVIERGVVITCEDVNEQLKAEFIRRETIKVYWNRVVIEHNKKFNGKDVLKAMFIKLFDTDACFPCYYECGENEDSFLLYMNFAPLNLLVLNNLQIRMNENDVVTIKLNLKCAKFKLGHVKWEEVIPKVVAKRMNAKKLNLNNFQSDPELKDIIVDMSTSFGLKYILECAFDQNSQIIEIDLSHNELQMLDGLEVLKKFPKLTTLNLSHNDINSLSGFPLNLKICELTMNQNPVCDNFNLNALHYVQIFKDLCSELQLLDGRKIDQTLKMYHFQNYYTSSYAYVAIDNFVNFFFKNYDAKENRHNLATIYNNKSMLSVRFGSAEPNFFYGQVEIADYYSSLPEMEHDFVCTSIDTSIFDEKKILITFNGVFKMKSNGDEDDEEKLYTFSRTFLLKKENMRAKGTLSLTYYFDIANEQLHYDSVKDDKIKNKAFKKRQATIGEIEEVFSERDTREKDSQEKLQLLKQTIRMKTVWCKR